MSIIKFLLIHKKVQSFGEEIYVLPDLLENRKELFNVTLFGCLFIFLGSLFLIIRLRELLFFAGIFFSGIMILQSLTIKKISQKNGIYENGIILGMFIDYKNIVSFEMLESNQIRLLLKNGKTIDLAVKDKKSEIEKIFRLNQIISVKDSY